MQFPKLTPLQSRLAATLLASVILVVLFITITRPQFAYAAELDSRIPPDHNHPIILDEGQFWEDDERAVLDNEGGEEMGSNLRARAPDGVTGLANNNPQNQNIEAGQTQNWVFTAEAISGPPGEVGPGLPSDDDPDEAEPRNELKRRQERKIIYITTNTCIKPAANSSVDSKETAGKIPPQLQLWISQSKSVERPGPNTKGESQLIDFDEGYAIFNASTSEDVFIGISAPNTTLWTGIWNYEIAASIDAPFHAFTNETNLYFVDGDNHAALLVTDDTTRTNASSPVYQKWMSRPPPYALFAHDLEEDSIRGLERSFCGLRNQAQITANLNNTDNQNVAKMVNRGLTGGPKEQFYIDTLNASSTYAGILALEGNSTASGASVVGGGGTVFRPITFLTKAASNCALMYNLSFCSEVAYAVPSNPDLFPRSENGTAALAALYDSHAANLYKNFNYSLQQIPCSVPSAQQYSLVRTCKDCARAYKTWLCAVTIPRCESFESRARFLKVRNTAAQFSNGSFLGDLGQLDPLYTVDELSAWQGSVATNSSRNKLIDEQVRPGPYKEVLPCGDLCYDLMQSCPASLGFSCPIKGAGMEESYGERSDDKGEISCSYLGAAYHLSKGNRMVVGMGWFAVLGLGLGIGAWSLL